MGILAPDGRTLAWEVKMPGKIPSAARLLKIINKPAAGHSVGERHDFEQWQFLQLVRRMGGFACYVDSVESAGAALVRAREGATE